MPPAQTPGSATGLADAPLTADRRPGRSRLIERLEASGRYPTWVLFAALAGMFATTFPITILTISLGGMAREFGTSETTMAWVISGPMLLSAVALPLLGKLGDLYGHRRVFLLGFAGATLVAGATAAAWSTGSVIGFRTVSAVLGGATQPTSMALIFSVYPPEHRVRAMGWWSMTGAAAPALGLVAGGPLVDWLGWRIVFILQAVISAGVVALAAMVLEETQQRRVRFDLSGAATLALGIAGFMFVLGSSRDLPFDSPYVLSALVVGAFGITSFIAIERRCPEPLVPLEFFSRRNFTAPMLSNAFMAAAYMGAFVIAPFALLEQFEFSISVAAGVMLLRTLTLTICSPLGGQLGYRLGERPAAMIGCAVMSCSLFLMSWAALRTDLIAFAAALILQGMGHGLGLPSLTSAISGAVSEQDLGIASAANRLTSSAGAAMGITLLSIVYAGRGTAEALAEAFLAGALLAVVSLVGAAAMASRRAGVDLASVPMRKI